MDPKHLLIAHGEKAAVLLIAGACAWVTISTFTDETVRPKGITQQTIDEHINAIDQRMNSKDVPTLKPAPPYLESMKARFGKEVPSPARMSWLMSHPDIGGIGHGIYFYIYELYEPTVAAKDNIGTIEMVVQPPRQEGGSDRRSSEPNTGNKWVRTTERTILNSARQLGVQVEISIGGGPWKAFKGPGVLEGGFVPLETLRKNGGKFTFPTEAVWQKHSFHAREIVKATGFVPTPDDNKNPPDDTVLVHEGHMDEPKDWTKEVSDAYAADRDGFLAQFVKGDKTAPPGVQLAKSELVYASEWSEPVSIQATADVRFAFEKSTADPSKPDVELGVFLLSKQFKRATGNVWLEKPEVFKVAKGDTLGGERDVHIPGDREGEKHREDLSTPFVLDEIKHNVERIIYYELDVKPREGDTKQKTLDFHPVKKPTDVAVIKNSKTGATLELARLMDVRKPARKDTIWYPVYPGDVYEEDKEFLKSPADFQQYGLVPAPPIKHAKDDAEGPLEQLKQQKNDSLFATDTDYIEMPDGRVIWWEPINKRLRIWPEPVEAATPGTTPPHGTTPPPAHGTTPPAHGTTPPHTTTPPRTPPTTQPPAVPPGFNGPTGGPNGGNGGYPTGGQPPSSPGGYPPSGGAPRR